MLETLSLAWTTWKLSVKRLGPYGATLLTLVVVVGYVLLSDYLEENHPEVTSRVEQHT